MSQLTGRCRPQNTRVDPFPLAPIRSTEPSRSATISVMESPVERTPELGLRQFYSQSKPSSTLVASKSPRPTTNQLQQFSTQPKSLGAQALLLSPLRKSPDGKSHPRFSEEKDPTIRSNIPPSSVLFYDKRRYKSSDLCLGITHPLRQSSSSRIPSQQ